VKQSASERPDPTLQRKAAIAGGGAFDHAGKVRVTPIPDFDLDRTIFQTLEGKAARAVMKVRVGKEVHWDDSAGQAVQSSYEAAQKELPGIDPELLRFMVQECDFDVEHADGSFLDHLYFCFEYTALHYPQGSALVMLLHSILGTGTNTFAMSADKIPALQALMSPSDWTQTEAFPSVLRLLYAGGLRQELRANLHRADSIEAIRFHRVIDNAPITLTGEQLWEALNYQLIHLVDFLPVANWTTHQNDTSFILFRDLYDLMGRAGKRVATVVYEPRSGGAGAVGEELGLSCWDLDGDGQPDATEDVNGDGCGSASATAGHEALATRGSSLAA
jgi:hypothetical protein